MPRTVLAAYDQDVPNRALPLLASNDTRATLEFYERLGFTSRGAPPEEWDYLIIESDGCELHFAGHTLGERTPGSAFVYAENIDVLGFSLDADELGRIDALGR